MESLLPRLQGQIRAGLAFRFFNSAAAGHFTADVDLFMRMSKSGQFDEFLSLPAYELLP